MGLVTPDGLPEVIWDRLALNDERDDDTLLVVQDFAGWYGTPDAETGDVDRALTDGSVPGSKVLRSAEMTLEGVVDGGTRATVVSVLDDLAARAASRDQLVVTVSDPRLGRTEQREVRATGRLEQTWRGPLNFTYSVPLRANDPRRYSTDLKTATLQRGQGATGRSYPDPRDPLAEPGAPDNSRTYRWRYGSSEITTRALLVNNGNVDAPVLVTYTGDLGPSLLTDGRGAIFLAALGPSERLFLNTETLAIWATGGHSRGSYLRPGTRPMWVPAGGQARPWSLYVPSGEGTVLLEWRDAWL